MSFLGSFSIGGALDKVLAAGDTDSPKVKSALKKLTDDPKQAMQKVMAEIQSGPKLHYSTAIKLLSLLLDNSTVSQVLKILPELEQGAQSDIATILNTSQRFDPHLLLPYLHSPLNLKICRGLLTAHRKKFKAARLLKAILKTDSDLWDTLFELIHANVDEPALAEAIALSHNKNATLREYVTSVIAEFNNPAALESLQTLLNDNDHMVRLEALRGLTRVRADLPAETLFRLMPRAKKDEAPLVHALLGYSSDPNLVVRFNQALFSKNVNLRPLAIQGLSQIINETNLRAVFKNLANKSELVREIVIQDLSESAGHHFSDALCLLMEDNEKAVRDIALEALIIADASDSKIAQAMSQALNHDIPAANKEIFINKLGDARSKSALTSLLEILTGNEQKLHTPALNALGKLGDERALAPVFESLNSDSPEQQYAALQCMITITPAKFALRMRDQLLKHAGHISNDAIETLIETVEALTRKHKLRITKTYQTTLEKLRKETSGEIDVPTPSTAIPAYEDSTGSAEPSGETLSPADLAMFGDTSEGIFGTADEKEVSGSEEPVADFAVELEEGLLLGNRYKLIREIGRGGYGSVWLIEDTFIQEEMIMKFLHQQLVSDDIAIERFIRELRLARKITHTNIIRLYDYLDLGQVSAISMEYFAGAPLSKHIHAGAMEPSTVIEISRTICRALQTAHDAGVVHRDMKPANILVDDDNVVKIVDFGIAAASKHAESRLTRTGTLIGTPTYISPEQIQGKVVDARTDLYSLGVIMYEMLAGRPPYIADDPMALIFLHVEGKAKRIEDFNPLVPADLANIIHRCISPNPDDRFQSMAELEQALASVKI